ncbi:MAG TPA: chromate efflux transporter [Actinomycetota bacterium]
MSRGDARRVSLATIAIEWGRIGVTGFGGPPAHIALLRRLCVEREGWLSAGEFEDGIAATGLLPGPASTQLAIYCAWRLSGPAGALVGALCFIGPGLLVILGLSALFLEARPPLLVTGAAAGAGAAVPAVALSAAAGLMPASRRRAGDAGRWRWGCYLAAGAVASAAIGPWLVAVIGACGFAEVLRRSRQGRPKRPKRRPHWSVLALPSAVGTAGGGGLLALAWVAFKVGALSYGGGFVIIPLMQHDAVVTYHWMTGTQFLGAVALGQLTPGPVVLTVAVVGYAAAGLVGGLLAALIAFAPSFLFILFGAPHFGRLRASTRVQGFLDGAGPAAIGGIAGASVPLGLALDHAWQVVVLALAGLWLLVARRGVVSALSGAAGLGVLAVLLGWQ